MSVVEQEHGATSSARIRWMLVALLGAVALGNIDVAVANTAAPAIQGDLGATGGQVALVVSGYTLAYGATLITFARLGRTRGHRRTFLLGLVGFTVASLVCGVAPEVWTLVVARVAQGAAASLMISQVLTGIQLHVHGAARARALGAFAAVLAGSAVVGQVAGGLIVSADLLGSSWRPVFLVNLPLGLALLALALRALPADDSLEETAERDVAGTLGLTAGLVLLILPLVLGTESGWPAWTWASLAAGLAALAGFAVHEGRLLAADRRPLLDLGLFGDRVIGCGLVAGTLSTATYFGLLFVVALYLQQGLGLSPAVSGVAMVPWVAAFGVTGPVLARLGSGARRLAAATGGAVLTAAFVLVAGALLLGATSVGVLAAVLGIGGLGFGATFSGTLSQLTGATSSEHAADVSGLFNTTTRVGGMIGVAVFGTLYAALDDSRTGAGAVHAFAWTAGAFAATALVATACSAIAARSARPAG